MLKFRAYVEANDIDEEKTYTYLYNQFLDYEKLSTELKRQLVKSIMNLDVAIQARIVTALKRAAPRIGNSLEKYIQNHPRAEQRVSDEEMLRLRNMYMSGGNRQQILDTIKKWSNKADKEKMIGMLFRKID